MNEREIERKLAEILSSRGNILPGFSSNGGQMGDQLMVTLDGIRDSVQGFALTSIPPGKIGAVFDKLLNQWYILSNEQPIQIREDKTERKHKEKPKRPDQPVKLLKTKEFPKILVLYKDPNLDTKIYEYYRKEFKFRMVLQQINYETSLNTIYTKHYVKNDYYTYFKENPYGLPASYDNKNYKYYYDVSISTIKEENKKCDGVVDVGSGPSGSGTQGDPYITEDIRKMDAIIAAHPGYSFYVAWASIHHEYAYLMSYLWGTYSSTIINASTAEGSGELEPIPYNPKASYQTGGKMKSYTISPKVPDFNTFGPGRYISCGDVNTCNERAAKNYGENYHYHSGFAYIISPIGFTPNSLVGSLFLQNNFYGTVNGVECQSLYVPQDYVCWIKVSGTSDYTYNYKITGFQAIPPTNNPEFINETWPGMDYFNTGGGSPGEDNYKEKCTFPELMENIFNIYKLYFYFKTKQFHLDIRPRTRTDQEHKVYLSSYTYKKTIENVTTEYNYDIVTQKCFKFIPDANSTNPLFNTNNYKFIFIDLFYFDETKQEVHNFTVMKYYSGFGIPVNLNNVQNDHWGLNTAIPWEYKLYKKNSITNKFEYKEEEIVYYSQKVQVVFTNNKYKPTVVGLTIPSMFQDWEIIVEKDWRRNISQVYLEVNETNADTQCIRNIRNNNYYTATFIEPTPPVTTEKKGTINFIDPEQQLKEFENKTLKEIIFNTTKKININRTDSDYKIGDFDPQTRTRVCKIEETGFKLMNIDGINKDGNGEYSLEGIIYSKNNKTKTSDL